MLYRPCDGVVGECRNDFRPTDVEYEGVLGPTHESQFRRFRWWIVGAALISFLPAVYWAILALGTSANKVADWLPPSNPEIRRITWFRELFEGDEILVVSWEGCTLDDPRLDTLAEAVIEPLPGIEGHTQQWFSWARTGRSVLGELTTEPLSLTRREALRRMEGWTVGPDGRQSCALLKVSEAGRNDRHSAVAAVKYAARERCGLLSEELRIGGSTFDSVAIDSESKGSLRILLGLSLAAAIVTSLVFIRSPRLVCLILVTAGLCEAWSLAIVWLSGTNMDLVLVMMPVLVGILAVSASIHQLNYYLNECGQRGIDGAPARALRNSWKPAAFSCFTTSLGLLSLLISDVAPVRKFGLFSAIGIAVSLVIMFLFLPAALECWPAANRSGSAASPGTECALSRRAYRKSWARLFARGAVRHYGRILAICVVATPLLVYGTEQIRTSVKLQDMFSPHSTVTRNYLWLESNVGPLVPVEIVVRFDVHSTSTLAERMKLVEQVRTTVDAVDKIGATISACTFAPPLPVGGGARQAAERRVILRKLEAAKPRLTTLHYLATTADAEFWRVSARVETFNDLDYGQLLDQLRSAIEPLIVAADEKTGEDVEVVVTGGIPAIYVVQRQLLYDLRSSFGAAFLTIALVLSVAVRSVRAGLVTMIPNVMPVLVVFGIMGLFDVVVDLGSMMTISTALGISVDNELHFFHWFRRSLNQGRGRRRALLSAYRRCGRPMAQTAVICSLGMLVFMFSPFTPVSHFGSLMSSLIALAMLGDQILLPALLVSPLGSFFQQRTKTGDDGDVKDFSHSDAD